MSTKRIKGRRRSSSPRIPRLHVKVRFKGAKMALEVVRQ
jgi:hypothetical protein